MTLNKFTPASGVFIVNFEQLIFVYVTLMPAAMIMIMVIIIIIIIIIMMIIIIMSLIIMNMLIELTSQ